jgi:hypothetical protein
MRSIVISVFKKEIQRLLPDDNYRMLQTALMLGPDAGSLIRRSGGLREIRWNLPKELLFGNKETKMAEKSKNRPGFRIHCLDGDNQML